MNSPVTSRRPWVLAAATAGATALLGVPVRRALLRWGVLDVPNHRSSHQVATPRGGGIAALLGATTATLTTGQRPNTAQTAAIISLAAVGLADDITGHVPARIRLTAQFLVGGSTLSHGGWDRPVSSVVTAGVVNVVNFMDGINGISGLTAIVWGVNAMLLGDESNGELATLGALAAGAGLGFLPHNAPSAKLFLGDIGSYAFGATVAAGILSQRSVRSRYRVAAPLLLYGADVSLALLRKLRAGKGIGEPHRDHVYQQLVSVVGLSHGQTSVLVGLLTAALCALWLTLPALLAASLSVPLLLGYLTSVWWWPVCQTKSRAGGVA